MSYEEMAEDVRHFLEERGLDKAHVIGHSMVCVCVCAYVSL